MASPQHQTLTRSFTSGAPVLDRQSGEVSVIACVERDQQELVGLCYHCDLPIRERWCTPQAGEARSLGRAPGGGTLVIRQDWHGRCGHLEQVLLARGAMRGGWEPIGAEEQLVPHNCGDG